MSNVSSATVADPRVLKAGFARLQGDDIDFVMRSYEITLGRATSGAANSKMADVALGAPCPRLGQHQQPPVAPGKLHSTWSVSSAYVRAQAATSTSPGNTLRYTTTSTKVRTACPLSGRVQLVARPVVALVSGELSRGATCHHAAVAGSLLCHVCMAPAWLQQQPAC